MTVKAQLADGRTLEFPDGTDPSVIQQTVKRLLGASAPASSGMSPGARPVQPDLTGRLPPNVKGSILPLSTDKGGRVQFDLSAGITGQIGNALALPGDIVTGKAQVMDPGGGFNQDTLKRAMGLGLMSTGIPPAARMLRTVPTQGQGLAAPAADVLQRVGRAGYDRATAMGVDYSPAFFAQTAHSLQQNLGARGLNEINSPETLGYLRRLQQPPQGAVAINLQNLLALREGLQHTAGLRDPIGRPTRDAQAAQQVVAELDQILTAPPAQSVLAGPAATAGAEIRNANQNYAAQHRSDAIIGREEDTGATMGMLQRGDANAAVANSGLNAGNNLRQQVRSLLNSPTRIRGFSREDLVRLRQVRDGMAGLNTMRWASSVLGGGGGLGTKVAGTIGGVVGGMVGGFPGMGIGSLAAPSVGLGLRTLFNRGVRRQLENVDELTRQRSPLYQAMVRTAPLTPTAPTAGQVVAATLPIIASTAAGGAAMSAYDFYWQAKQEREALDAANEQMRRGLE